MMDNLHIMRDRGISLCVVAKLLFVCVYQGTASSNQITQGLSGIIYVNNSPQSVSEAAHTKVIYTQSVNSRGRMGAEGCPEDVI